MRVSVESRLNRVEKGLKVSVRSPSASHGNPKVHCRYALPVPIVMVIEINVEDVRGLFHPTMGASGAHFCRAFPEVARMRENPIVAYLARKTTIRVEGHSPLWIRQSVLWSCTLKVTSCMRVSWNGLVR